MLNKLLSDIQAEDKKFSNKCLHEFMYKFIQWGIENSDKECVNDFINYLANEVKMSNKDSITCLLMNHYFTGSESNFIQNFIYDKTEQREFYEYSHK